MSARKPALAFIFVTLMLDVLGFGLLIPVAPRLVQELQGPGANEQTAAGPYALLVATYAAMQFLFAPALGLLSDRFGRRPVILLSQLGSGLDYFAMALAPTLPILYITRAINGLSGASITAASAYVADVTPPEKRAAGFGMVGAAFGLGFVLGPLIGGYLGQIDTRLPFYGAGVLTLCNWFYGLLILPESLPRERRVRFTLARANPLGSLRGLGKYPMVAGLAASFFLVHLANFGLHATWVLYTTHKFGWGPAEVGWSLFAVGIGAAVVQGGLARKVIPWLGERRALMLGLLLMVATFVGYGIVPRGQGWLVFVVIGVGSLAGLGQPAAQALITKAVRPTEQGATQGALTAIQCVANIMGPLIGAGVFAYFISARAPVYMPGAAFYLGAALVGLGAGVAAWAVARIPGHVDDHRSEEPLAGAGPSGAAPVAEPVIAAPVAGPPV